MEPFPDFQRVGTKQEENMHTDDMTNEDREIQELLKDYPMPQATAEFFDQALARATHEGSRRQRNRARPPAPTPAGIATPGWDLISSGVLTFSPAHKSR